MNLRDLEYFKYLSESLSFTKTAEHFFVSQPSISIALRRLEEEFNTTLIQRERSSKRISLTSTGKILYQRTIDILRLYHQVHNEINQIDAHTSTLGFVSDTGPHFLPLLLNNAQDYTKTLRLLDLESSDDLITALRHKECESAILMHDSMKVSQKWLTQHLIVEENLTVCLTSEHPLAHYRQLSLNDIHNESFVSFVPGHTHEKIFHNWLTASNISFDQVTYVKDIHALITLVANGSHIALLIPSIELDSPNIIRIPLLNAPIGYVSFVSHQDTTNPHQLAFNKTIIDTLLTLKTNTP